MSARVRVHVCYQWYVIPMLLLPPVRRLILTIIIQRTESATQILKT